VKDYPQVSVRLPIEVKRKLRALVLTCKQPQWRLIVEAVDCYIRNLPSGDRHAVRRLLKRRQQAHPSAR
jgi:predicted DNA-binding protein